jgi:hypothetical protein
MPGKGEGKTRAARLEALQNPAPLYVATGVAPLYAIDAGRRREADRLAARSHENESQPHIALREPRKSMH